MKTLLFILILITLAQTTFIPLNLALIIIICRSFAFEDYSNYYLALFIGIILGILSTTNLGFWAFVFLINAKLAHIIRILPITANIFTVIPVSLTLITVSTYFESYVFQTKLNFLVILIESILSLPIFILIKGWEERFIVRPEIKLRIKN